MTDQERMTRAKKEEIFFAEGLKGWMTSSIEKDKAFLTLSWAGVTAMIGFLAATKTKSHLVACAVILCIIAFISAIWYTMKAFDMNRQIIKNEISGALGQEQISVRKDLESKADNIDRRAQMSFFAGMVMAALSGLIYAVLPH